jgi:NAD+ kinase
MRRVGFAYNPIIDLSAALLERGMRWCDAHGVEAWSAAADDAPALAELRDGSDAVVILGGDGTFLRTARALGGSRIPLLGVNLGRVGFLAKVETAGLERALEQVRDGAYRTDERLRVGVAIRRRDGEERHTCLNEVAVARGAHARVMRLEVEVSGSHLATYVADAVIVATPTGSTAYSFSAGGPILDPSLRNMIITPVAAYLSPIHSVVVGPSQVVTVTLREASEPALVSLDGQADVPIEAGARVEVRALDEPLCLIEPEGSVPFYDLVRTKASLLPY